jgi:hypothetical protein
MNLKSKISTFVLDGGSNMIKLFKQIYLEKDRNEISGNDNNAENNDEFDIDSEEEETDELTDELLNQYGEEITQFPINNDELVNFYSTEENMNSINNSNEENKNRDEITLNDNIQEKSIEITEDDFDSLITDNCRQLTRAYSEISLNFGSDDIPRIYCSCHKLNIAVRLAMEKHGIVLDLIKGLNKQNDYIRTTQILNEIVIKHRCRFRLENATRWGSAFLVLGM